MASTIAEFIVERMAQFFPTLDTETDSDFYSEVVQPIIYRLGNDPFDTDIEAFIKQRIRENYSSLDVDSAGTTRIPSRIGIDNNIISEYEALPVKASDCIQCDICVERCPFGVDIIANMTRAVDIFGK